MAFFDYYFFLADIDFFGISNCLGPEHIHCDTLGRWFFPSKIFSVIFLHISLSQLWVIDHVDTVDRSAIPKAGVSCHDDF